MNETLPQDAHTLSTGAAQVPYGVVYAVLGRARYLHRMQPEFELDQHIGQAAVQLASRFQSLFPWLERADLQLYLAEAARSALAALHSEASS